VLPGLGSRKGSPFREEQGMAEAVYVVRRSFPGGHAVGVPSTQVKGLCVQQVLGALLVSWVATSLSLGCSGRTCTNRPLRCTGVWRSSLWVPGVLLAQQAMGSRLIIRLALQVTQCALRFNQRSAVSLQLVEAGYEEGSAWQQGRGTNT
jgi:hypothetical protein